MSRTRCAVVAAALFVASPSTSDAAAAPDSAAAARTFTVRAGASIVREIGPFRPRRDPTIGAAVRAFGEPSSRRLLSNETCVVKWRRLGLRINFVNLGGAPPGLTTCSDGLGRAQSVVIKGRRFRTWKGLRVGMSREQVLRRHPAAEPRGNKWWLRTAVSPFGDGSEYPVLAAVGRAGRIVAFEGWIGAAGE